MVLHYTQMHTCVSQATEEETVISMEPVFKIWTASFESKLVIIMLESRLGMSSFTNQQIITRWTNFVEPGRVGEGEERITFFK